MNPRDAACDEVFIVAGEPSGDLIGSLLVRNLLELRPDLKITCIGGDQMAEAGAEVRVNIVRDLAIIGFAEVVAKFPQIRRLFYDTVAYLRENRPRVLVLIDYPGFNLRLAKKAHELGIKVVYYVIPQVWAWHRSRVHNIRRYVDLCLVIFPFEKDFLEGYGARAEHVGHPLQDIIKITMTREEVCRHFDIDPARRLIGLLPGSRSKEIDALLPIMLEAGEKIREAVPNLQFVLPRASSVELSQIEGHLARASLDVKVVDSFRYNVRKAMDFALVASGTATLETGLLGCPMVILYRVSYPSWFIAKMLIKIPYAGLVNIVADDMVVPELLQDKCTAENVSEHCIRILCDGDEVTRIRYQLDRVREKLGGPGASRRAAEHVLAACDGAIADKGHTARAI